LGCRHLETLIVMDSLAYIWKSQGQDKGAIAWMRWTGRLQKGSINRMEGIPTSQNLSYGRGLVDPTVDFVASPYLVAN
jgi:hypothetical protein